MAPGLLRIPTELQHMIANLTDRKCILALRLVCRDLSRAVDDPFLERFYSKRRHLITPYSLEYLVEISKDARLRGRLREVEFVIAELPSWIRESYYDVPPSLLGGTTEDDLNYAQACKETNLARTALLERWAIERELMRSKLTMDLMATALRNMTTANIIPTISLGSNTTYSTVAYGARQLATKLVTYPAIRSTSLRSIFRQDLEYDSTGTAYAYLNMILSAVADIQYPVRELVVLDNTPLHLSGSCLGSSQRDCPEKAFKNLTALKVSVKGDDERSYEDEDDGDEDDVMERNDENQEGENPRKMTSLSKVLNMTSSLRRVDVCLGYDGKYYDDYVDSKLGAYFCNNWLEEITLNAGLFTLSSLKAILEPHGYTLRTLKLFGNAMDTTDDWRHVLTWISATMNLDYLKLWGAGAGSSLVMREEV